MTKLKKGDWVRYINPDYKAGIGSIGIVTGHPIKKAIFIKTHVGVPVRWVVCTDNRDFLDSAEFNVSCLEKICGSDAV